MSKVHFRPVPLPQQQTSLFALQIFITLFLSFPLQFYVQRKKEDADIAKKTNKLLFPQYDFWD